MTMRPRALSWQSAMRVPLAKYRVSLLSISCPRPGRHSRTRQAATESDRASWVLGADAQAVSRVEGRAATAEGPARSLHLDVRATAVGYASLGTQAALGGRHGRQGGLRGSRLQRGGRTSATNKRRLSPIPSMPSRNGTCGRRVVMHGAMAPKRRGFACRLVHSFCGAAHLRRTVRLRPSSSLLACENHSWPPLCRERCRESLGCAVRRFHLRNHGSLVTKAVAAWPRERCP